MYNNIPKKLRIQQMECSVFFSNSSAIFQAIENRNQELLENEISKCSKEELVKCTSGLIRHKKILKSYNLLEACCLSENEEALHHLLITNNLWDTVRLKGATRIAASTKKYSLMNELIRFGFSVMNALLEACHAGNIDLVKNILKQNDHGINISDSAPIFKAAAGGYRSILTTLNDCGFDLRAQQDEALCIAVREKHIDCVHFLISIGANVSTQAELPIKTAIINGDLEMVKELLDSGSELIKVAEEEFVTLAERYKKTEIANILRNKLARMHISPHLNTKQSTHASSVDQSAAESALRLQARYGKYFDQVRLDQEITSITTWGDSLKGDETDLAAHRAIDHILHGTEIHKSTGISLKELLILVWIAIHDDLLRIGGLSDALEMLKEGLYELQRGYNLPADIVNSGGDDDIDICKDGKLNKLMEKLVGVHPDVTIDFITKEVASFKLRAVVVQEAKILFQSRSPLLVASMFNKNNVIEGIWDLIREKVKEKMFEEFSVLFKSYDDPDFNVFIDMGICTDLELNGVTTENVNSELNTSSVHKLG